MTGVGRRATAGLCLVALVAPLLLVAPASATAERSDARSTERPRRVLIISVPRITWRDIVDFRPRHMISLLDQSAVSSMSVRSIGSRTSLGEGYATIGSGNRTGVADSDAGNALGPTEPFEDGTARATYTRRTGWRPRGAALQVDIASVLRTNKKLLYGAEPGIFGGTLADHGWKRAVVGNADFGVEGVPSLAELNAGGSVDSPPRANSSDPSSQDTTSTAPVPSSLNRSSALALMDRRGRVSLGDVTRDLLVRDSKSPFGIRTNRARFLQRFGRVWRDHSAVLVEMSDLERADRYARAATESEGEALRRTAVGQADVLVGAILRSVDAKRDLVVFVSPASPRDHEETTPFGMRGPGIRAGITQSATTRRLGYVTLPDVAPTILDMLGIDQPTAMNGALINERGTSGTGVAKYRTFETRNTITRFRDQTAGPISVWFVVFELFGLAFAVLSLSVRRQGLRPWAMFLALVTLAFPTVTFLAGLVRVDHLGYAGFTFSLFGFSVLLALAAQQVGFRLVRRGDPRSAMLPPLLLVGLLWVLQIVDIVTGGRLQIDTVFGYSPVVAGRFAGYGNLAFALLAIATVVLSTGLWGLARIREAGEGARKGHVGLALVVAIFLVAIVADGYPAFGSDVGGVLALVPAGAVIVLVLSGRRVNLGKVAVIAGASVAVLAVFAGIDLARPPEDRTHLGRLVASTATSGGGLGTVLSRKLSANLHVLTSSVFIWIIPSALAFLAFLTWRRRGFIRNLMEFVPGIRACMWGAIIVAVLGFALNDSGMAIPAMMFPVLLPYLMHMVVQPDSGPDAQAPRWLEALLSRLGRDDEAEVHEAEGWSMRSRDDEPVTADGVDERSAAEAQPMHEEATMGPPPPAVPSG